MFKLIQYEATVDVMGMIGNQQVFHDSVSVAQMPFQVVLDWGISPNKSVVEFLQ